MIAAAVLVVLVRERGLRLPAGRGTWVASSFMAVVGDAPPFWLIGWESSTSLRPSRRS